MEYLNLNYLEKSDLDGLMNNDNGYTPFNISNADFNGIKN